MADIFKLISIILGFAFPIFLIKAIRTKNEDAVSRYSALSCVSFGIIVLTVTLTEIQNKNLSISKWAEVVRRHINLQELDRTAIDELIDHIEIGERVILDGNRTQAIRVCYRFIGQIG